MIAQYEIRMKETGIPVSAVVGNLLTATPSPPMVETEYTNFDIAAVGLGFHHFQDSQLTVQRLVERLKPKTGVLLILDWLPSDQDPNYQGPPGGMMHHHHHHGHQGHQRHGHEHKQDDKSNEETQGLQPESDKAVNDKPEEKDPFKAMRATIAHDGFNQEMMRKLYEDAGLADFGFATLEEPIELRMGGKGVVRTPFLSRGRRA